MADFGISMFAIDSAIHPATLALAAEERGFESLFLPEHTHIPVSRRSPWPGGSELPKDYWHTNDLFIGLAMAAAVTQRLKLGTGICLVTEHDPILLAKQVATLDSLSGGRVILGVGAGWNAEEMENHGVAFEDRWKILRERVLAIRQIWTQDAAEFHGKFVDFDPIWAYPKPRQTGGPPILLGADTKWAYQRVVEYCDGWMPQSGRKDSQEGLRLLKAAASEVGRSMDTIQLTALGVGPDEDYIRALIDAGFQRIVLKVDAAPAEVVLPTLDRYAELAQRLG